MIGMIGGLIVFAGYHQGMVLVVIGILLGATK